ncbi:MAG TPA: hypothetical protein VE684_20875 [Crenalkalicoccus sp.]|nr:hypothetical protein [Crenalkalicoccus sp.]
MVQSTEDTPGMIAVPATQRGPMAMLPLGLVEVAVLLLRLSALAVLVGVPAGLVWLVAR